MKHSSAKHSFILALITGLVTYAIASHWVWLFLTSQLAAATWLGSLASAIYWAWMAAGFALALFIYQKICAYLRVAVFRQLAFTCCMLIHFFVMPSLFPASLAFSQGRFLFAMQPVSLFGEVGLCLVIILVNVVITDLTLPYFRKLVSTLDTASGSFRRQLLASSPSLFIILSWFICAFYLSFSPYILHDKEVALTAGIDNGREGRLLKIGWIQPNFSTALSDERGDNAKKNEAFTKSFPFERHLSDQLSKDVDLIIWPEYRSRGILNDPISRAVFKDLAQTESTDYIIQDLRTIDNNLYNSIGFFPHHRDQVVFYNKQKLIPFGETLPNYFGLPRLSEYLFGDFTRLISPGQQPARFDGGSYIAGGLICYDLLFPELLHNAIKQWPDIQFFIVVSNNAWFDSAAQSTLMRTATQLRALETNRTIFHITNNGPSWVVSPNGVVNLSSPANETGAYSVNLMLPTSN